MIIVSLSSIPKLFVKRMNEEEIAKKRFSCRLAGKKHVLNCFATETNSIFSAQFQDSISKTLSVLCKVHTQTKILMKFVRGFKAHFVRRPKAKPKHNNTKTTTTKTWIRLLWMSERIGVVCWCACYSHSAGVCACRYVRLWLHKWIHQWVLLQEGMAASNAGFGYSELLFDINNYNQVMYISSDCSHRVGSCGQIDAGMVMLNRRRGTGSSVLAQGRLNSSFVSLPLPSICDDCMPELRNILQPSTDLRCSSNNHRSFVKMEKKNFPRNSKRLRQAKSPKFEPVFSSTP